MLRPLESRDKKSLIQLARQTLERLYDEDPTLVLKQFANQTKLLSETLLENLPCFVTLMTEKGRLRGCVGGLYTHQSLYKNVYQFTRTAALEDPRFDAVQPEEVKHLVIHLSVLGPITPLPSIASLKLGQQGLYVAHGGRRGVLLADVAIEHEWTREEFLKQTCVKAGLPEDNTDDYEISYFDQIAFGEGD
jgi:AmmeMemoRadiSam system protein A